MKAILAAFALTALATLPPVYMANANSGDEVLLVNRVRKKNSVAQPEIARFNSVNDIVPRSPAARVAKKFLQSVEAQDTNAISQLWTQDAALESPFDIQGRDFPNREVAQRYIEEIVSLFSEIRFEQISIYDTRNPKVVIIEAQGDFVVAENGTPYRNKYVFIIQVRGNKVSLIREYFDPLIIARTFGIDVTPN